MTDNAEFEENASLPRGLYLSWRAQALEAASFWYSLSQWTLTTLEHSAKLFTSAGVLTLGTTTSGFTLASSDTATSTLFILVC